MTQTLLALVTAFMLTIAPIFHLPTTGVVPFENLANETAPAVEKYRTFDEVKGVSDSVFYIARPKTAAYTVKNAAEFGLSVKSADNYDAFLKAVEYCRENPGTRFDITSGKYYFRTAKRIEISGLKNILFNANGATFVFENPDYFSVSNCDCVEFSGLSVTWNLKNSRLGSIVKVQNVDTKAHSFEILFTELSDVDENVEIAAFTQYDAASLTPGVSDDFKESYVYQYPEIITSVKKTARNVLKITHDGSLDTFKNGDVFLLRHKVYEGNVFAVANSKNITFSGVNIYAAAGMGWLITDRCERFQLLDCVIGLDPDFENTHRVSATADGVHIANTNGKFRISGCDFSFMGDDAVNVHDNVVTVTKRLGANELEVYSNVINFKKGDTAVFCDKEYNKLGIEIKIKAVDGNKLTFEGAVPESVNEGCIIYNGSLDSGNYVLTNNYFHENRARGLLLQSSNGLCENNRFYKIMANPIKIVLDIKSGSWLEGRGVNNLSVKNNSFKECNVVEWGAQIEIDTNINDERAARPMFFNITVENNLFESFMGPVLRARNASNLSFCNNEIENTSGKIAADRGRIKIKETCAGVKISGNSFAPTTKAPFQGLIEVDDPKSLI